MKLPTGDNIKVFVRVRPFNQKQKQKSTQPCLLVDNNTITMRDKQPDHRFTFDHVFQPISTQEEIYSLVGHDVVNAAFEGFNGTVFAYGQTSSGKTHTCIGPDCLDQTKRGILPRMISHLYQKIKQQPNHIEFRIKISVIEIYMQKIKDLLDTTKTDLRIREKVGKGIYIQDVTEQYVASEQQTISIIKRGIVNRSVGQTLMNDNSSRSHMAFILTLYQNNLKDASAKSGRIILVDLAGSQKTSKTGAEGKLLDEAKNINKSLLALGNVINALIQNKITHVPYRDSKLTRLLQESLGGNSKTNLIVNISPSDYNEQETLSSLRFGNRAKQIKNKPKVNREYTVAELLLLLEKAEKKIQELELIITELSEKRPRIMKKTSKIVENLIDSDHPILETDHEIKSQDQRQPQHKNTPLFTPKQRSKLKTYIDDSQYQEQSQNQKDLTSKSDIKIYTNNQITQNMKKLSLEKQVLAQEIQTLNIQKVQISRQLDILQEKYDYTLKQNKINQSKLQSTQKQNDKLLEKLVAETSLLHEHQLKCEQLQQKINLYQQRILSLATLHQRQTSKSKPFNTIPSQLLLETKKIADLIKTNQSKQDQLGLITLQDKINTQLEATQNKNQLIKDLQLRNKTLNEQLILFKHLDSVKEALIQDKLNFSAERDRLYKDLENRIEKVLHLEQKLDEQQQKTYQSPYLRKYYQQLIKSQQSQKSRKILLLQSHLKDMSQNYYILKNQQSSWSKDTKRVQSKLQEKKKIISALEKQIGNLRQEIERLKIQLEDVENYQKEQSILDLDLSVNEGSQEYYKPKIVKIIKSSFFHSEPDIF